jgi:small subunit ribosomal protein S6
MATEAPIYDLTLLLDADADSERRDKIVADVETLIARHGGELVGRHDWGVRHTAYEVHKKATADYHLIQFYATNEVLEALDHTLKITDGINRFRVIKLRPGTPAPPDLRAEAGDLEEAEQQQ